MTEKELFRFMRGGTRGYGASIGSPLASLIQVCLPTLCSCCKEPCILHAQGPRDAVWYCSCLISITSAFMQSQPTPPTPDEKSQVSSQHLRRSTPLHPLILLNLPEPAQSTPFCITEHKRRRGARAHRTYLFISNAWPSSAVSCSRARGDSWELSL